MSLYVSQVGRWIEARGGYPRMLYHYTDAPGFDALRRSGVLPPEELVIRHRRVRLRHAFTWLTDDTDVSSPAVQTVARLGQDAEITVRLTVSIANAQRWSIWQLDHHIPRRTLALIDDVCEGLTNRLWVVRDEIPRSDWIIAEDLESKSVLWRADLRSAAS